jgi:hypothetical protein
MFSKGNIINENTIEKKLKGEMISETQNLVEVIRSIDGFFGDDC